MLFGLLIKQSKLNCDDEEILWKTNIKHNTKQYNLFMVSGKIKLFEIRHSHISKFLTGTHYKNSYIIVSC